MDRAGALFSEPRLQAVLGQVDGAPPEAIIHDIVDSVQRYADGVPQSDDITLLAIRYRGAGCKQEGDGSS